MEGADIFSIHFPLVAWLGMDISALRQSRTENWGYWGLAEMVYCLKVYYLGNGYIRTPSPSLGLEVELSVSARIIYISNPIFIRSL